MARDRAGRHLPPERVCHSTMNILLIGLHYHHYTTAIADELRALGHAVRLHDLQPRDLAMKTLRVVSPSLWQARLDSHHRRILEAERDTPTDLVLFIQAHQMQRATLRGFRDSFPGARFALYNWDSIANHDYLDRAEFFDTIQTFDAGDAAKHGFIYLPLFASREFQNVPDRVDNARSLYFVGNIVNPNRYRALDRFRAFCAREGIDFRLYMACTPLVRSRLWRQRIRPRGLSHGAIAPDRFRALLETSNAVFDFANHAQTGYTMRIFENLCAGKKIVTNNRRIMTETFYSPDRILVVEGDDYSTVPGFLRTPLVQPDQSFAEYHIQAFARHLAAGTGHTVREADGVG